MTFLFERKYLGFLLLSALLLGGLAFAWTVARARAEGGTISVCVRNNGLVYVIGEGVRRESCHGRDQLLTWNAEGPAGPQGVPGEQGPQGPVGPMGPAGAAGTLTLTQFYYRSANLDVEAAPAPRFARVRLECDPGDVALGGGYVTPATGSVSVVRNAPPITARAPGTPPVPNPSMWEFEVRNDGTAPATIVTYLRCMRLVL